MYNTSMQTSPKRTLTAKDIFFLPIGCLLRVSPLLMGIVFAALVVIFAWVYFNTDSKIFGSIDFDSYKISRGFESLQDEFGNSWEITYETKKTSHFSGLVRHTSPIRFFEIPFLSHDILVTSGDFADRDRVSTQVFNHHFYWQSREKTYPTGTINLLHTVPADNEISSLLASVSPGDTVKISGREILRIDAYDENGKFRKWWQDQGCNTLLVTAVDIDKP